MKRLISLVLSCVFGVGVLTGCSGKDNSSEENYKVAIAQFAPHSSLDNCVEGFKQGMAKAGFVEGENVKYDEENAQADINYANQIAQSMVASDYDLLCGVATPMAQAMFNASNGKIPVIYTAVTDPIKSELAKEDGFGVGNVTGTSDKLAIEAQLEMIRKFMPNAKKIGILYTTSEVNSISAIEEYKKLSPKYGFEIVEGGISQVGDISLAATDLVGKVDCLSNLTDNTVVTGLAAILDAAKKANVPVFGSEIEQVKNGCVATEGLDYVALGEQTGQMAARVLKGEDINSIPFETISEYKLYINSEALASFGLTCPEDLKQSAIEAE